MIGVTATRAPERSIHSLILGVSFIGIAIGQLFLHYPPLIPGVLAIFGVIHLLEYSSTRVRRVMVEFRSQVSTLPWIAVWAGIGAILFWRYGYRLWAIGSLFFGVVLLCIWFIRHLRKR